MQRKQKTGFDLSLEITPWWAGGAGSVSKHKLFQTSFTPCARVSHKHTKYHFLLLVRVVWCGGKLFQISSMPCAGGHYKAQSFVDDHLFLLICAHSKDAFRDFQTHTSHFCFAFEHLSLYIQKHLSHLVAVCGSLWQSVALLDHNYRNI